MDKKNKKTCCFLGFSAHLGQKKILNFFHLENFLNSDIFGHMLIIVGHLGSFKGDWSKALFIFDGFPLNNAFESKNAIIYT